MLFAYRTMYSTIHSSLSDLCDTGRAHPHLGPVITPVVISKPHYWPVIGHSKKLSKKMFFCLHVGRLCVIL